MLHGLLKMGDGNMSKIKDMLSNTDYDLADEITIANLLSSYDNILHNEAHSWTHPDDIAYYEEIKTALRRVIKHYSTNGDYLIEKVIRNSKDKVASKLAKHRIATMGNNNE